MIEVEVRSFLSEDEYDHLLDFMENNAKLVKDDHQLTLYFKGPHDLRIQRNDFYSKIWLKGGKIHDRHREEIEIKVESTEFTKLKDLFLTLGYEVEIKWYRKRKQFEWNNLDVFIDHTLGYGRVIEIEQMCDGSKKEKIYEKLEKALESLNIEKSDRSQFEKRYEKYKKNWREILSDYDLKKQGF